MGMEWRDESAMCKDIVLSNRRLDFGLNMSHQKVIDGNGKVFFQFLNSILLVAASDRLIQNSISSHGTHKMSYNGPLSYIGRIYLRAESFILHYKMSNNSLERQNIVITSRVHKNVKMFNHTSHYPVIAWIQYTRDAKKIAVGNVKGNTWWNVLQNHGQLRYEMPEISLRSMWFLLNSRACLGESFRMMLQWLVHEIIMANWQSPG